MFTKKRVLLCRNCVVCFRLCLINVSFNRTGRAVRCMLDRDEDMLISGGRHPFLGRYKVCICRKWMHIVPVLPPETLESSKMLWKICSSGCLTADVPCWKWIRLAGLKHFACWSLGLDDSLLVTLAQILPSSLQPGLCPCWQSHCSAIFPHLCTVSYYCSFDIMAVTSGQHLFRKSSLKQD